MNDRIASLTNDTPGGPRIAMGVLFSSFSVGERAAWERWAGVATCDDEGLFPESVERFFTDYETRLAQQSCQEAIVAKKKVVGKTAKGTRSKMKSAGNSKADPNQQNLPGVEPDPRIPMIESSVKRLLQIKSEKAALKEEADQLQDKVAGLLEKNELSSYKCLGKEVFLEPNGFKLKIKTAKG